MTSPDLLQSALADIDRARSRLHDYADETDNPAPGAVDAADLLDAALDALDGVA